MRLLWGERRKQTHEKEYRRVQKKVSLHNVESTACENSALKVFTYGAKADIQTKICMEEYTKKYSDTV